MTEDAKQIKQEFLKAASIAVPGITETELEEIIKSANIGGDILSKFVSAAPPVLVGTGILGGAGLLLGDQILDKQDEEVKKKDQEIQRTKEMMQQILHDYQQEKTY